MSNTGSLVLDLINAEGNHALEPDCTVEFVRLDGVTIARADHLQFPPLRKFSLPAFPQAQNLHCVITPSLYNIVQSQFFTLTDGQSKNDSAIVLRDPGKWNPHFTPWNSLTPTFDPLKAVIKDQHLRLKDGVDIGIMTPALFDGLASAELVLAKMALLNLFTVLNTKIDPVSGLSWFTFVKQVLVMDQERFVAIVDSKLFESVDHILQNPGTFNRQGFFSADASLHPQNIPGEYVPTAVAPDDPMISVKSNYKEGNVQFTVGRFRGPAGDCILLDCDMDEHHNLILHVSDLFKHVFTGGTNPIDIHEYIVSVQPGVDLGYGLEPKRAAAADLMAA